MFKRQRDLVKQNLNKRIDLFVHLIGFSFFHMAGVFPRPNGGSEDGL